MLLLSFMYLDLCKACCAIFVALTDCAVLQKAFALQAGIPPEIVYNAINQSELLSTADIKSFHLEEKGPLHWKLLGAGSHHLFSSISSKALLVDTCWFEESVVLSIDKQKAYLKFAHSSCAEPKLICSGDDMYPQTRVHLADCPC